MVKKIISFFISKFCKLAAVISILFVSSFALTGCQSTDTSSSVAYLQFRCNPSSQGTLISYNIEIENNSIYDMEAVHFKFNLFDHGTFLFSTDYIDREIKVNHGDTVTFSGGIDVSDVSVNRVEFKSWYSDDLSFWQTYQVWFIVSIVLVSLASIAYIIWIFVEDEDLDEVWDDITSSSFGWIVYTIPTLLIILFSSIIPVANVGWVPLCIIGGSIVSFVCLALLGHMAHHFVTYGFSFDYGSNNCYDEESLREMTKKDLIQLCKDNEISGYSNLNKEELIELILSEDDDLDEDLEEEFEDEEGDEEDDLEETIEKANRKPKNKKERIMFDSIAGLDEAKQAFEEKVILPFKYPDVFKKYNKKSGGGILLYGLPGTGKTMFAEAASNEVDALFIPIKCSDIKSKWYGESESKVKNIFEKARKAKKAIIFFDEFEAIGAKRTDDGDNGNNDLVPQILAEMQGVGNYDSATIVVIAATNKPWAIDSAFMRPGRFDEKIFIPLPDLTARTKLFELNLKSVPKEDELDIALLAQKTEGFNGADIKEICEKLKMQGIKESLLSKKEHKISNDDINKILPNIKSSVSLEDIEKLEDFNK